MTLEELLSLPQDGWLKISQMSEEELATYLEGITVIEPVSLEELSPATPNIGAEDKIKNEKKKMKAERKAELLSLANLDDGLGADNPIKSNPKKVKKFKIGGGSKEDGGESMDDFMKTLL